MSNALATREELPKNDIRALLQSDRVRGQIELALPRHLDPDRMMRVALTAVNKNPKLLECSKESVLLALMTCSQYGVEPDGRYAHLIPYSCKVKQGGQDRWVTMCQFQWDYKGLVSQIRKAPDVADIYADLICANDVYKISRGLHRDLIHEVDISKPRGPVIAAYSVCQFRDGTASFELMTTDEIDAIRKRSKSYDKDKDCSFGPWATDWGEMAKKTVIKRHSKTLPLPSEVATALHADSEFDSMPRAQDVEIRPANIPTTSETATLPDRPAETTAEPQKEPTKAQAESRAETAEPAPKAKKLTRKPRATKDEDPFDPPKAESEVEAEATTESPVVRKARNLLAEAGFTAGELIAVAKANDWPDEPTAGKLNPEEGRLSDLPDDWLEIATAGDDWDWIKDAMQRAREEGGDK